MWDFLSIIPISVIILVFLLFIFNFYIHYVNFVHDQVKIDNAISNANRFIMKNCIYSNIKLPDSYNSALGIEVNGRKFGKSNGTTFVEFPVILDGKIKKVKCYA